MLAYKIIFWVLFYSVVMEIWWKIRKRIDDGIFEMGLREDRIEFFKKHKQADDSYVLVNNLPHKCGGFLTKFL
jgi:hypothetical protein